MSSCWLRRDSEILQEDWRLISFIPNKSDVFTIEKNCGDDNGDDVDTSRYALEPLTSDDEWKKWLEKCWDTPNQNDACWSKINVALGGKGSSLEQLPFSSETFSRLKKSLMIHGSSLIRVINRQTSPVFSNFAFNWRQEDAASQRSIVYNCRSSAAWDGDMVLSTTFFPDLMTTNAVWFGCDLSKRRILGHMLTGSELITGRLSNFDGEVFHPMVLPVIFADLERDRQIEFARTSRAKLLQKILDLESPEIAGEVSSSDSEEEDLGCASMIDQETCVSGSPRMSSFLDSLIGMRQKRKEEDVESGSTVFGPNSTSEEHDNEKKLESPFPTSNSASTSSGQKSGSEPEDVDSESAVSMWLDVSCVKSGLEAWRGQLLRMAEHTDDLHDPTEVLGVTMEPSRLKAWKQSSLRVKDRLCELLDEYEEHIRECRCVMDGLKLAAQMEMNIIGRSDNRNTRKIARVNLEVAKMARRDGSLMASIALLGMIFLPATFVTAFFSMDFFEWENQDDSYTISPHLWMYGVTAAGLTIITVGIFYAFAIRQPQGDGAIEEEEEVA